MGPCLVIFLNQRKAASEARSLFSDLGINVVRSCRFLGGVIGDRPGRERFLAGKVSDWCLRLKLLSEISVTQPQASYVALVKSLQQEWSFVQRVSLDCSNLFSDIEHSLLNNFLPSLLGTTNNITSDERLLFSLPVRMGGLNRYQQLVVLM